MFLICRYLSHFERPQTVVQKRSDIGTSSGPRSMMHLYLFMRFSIFHVTRMSETTVTFGREIVAHICTSPRGILNCAASVNAGLFIYSSCAHNAYTHTHTSRIAMRSACLFSPPPAPPRHRTTQSQTGPPIKTDGDGEIIYEGVRTWGSARAFSISGLGGCARSRGEITLRYEYDVTRIPDELSWTRKLCENYHRAGYITLARR